MDSTRRISERGASEVWHILEKLLKVTLPGTSVSNGTFLTKSLSSKSSKRLSLLLGLRTVRTELMVSLVGAISIGNRVKQEEKQCHSNFRKKTPNNEEGNFPRKLMFEYRI